MKKILKNILMLIIVLFFLSNCGYNWQGKSSIWKDKGVEKIYIKNLSNTSLRSGVESQFTSALVKTFSRSEDFRVVSSKQNADAIIEGSVDSVSSVGGDPQNVNSLTKQTIPGNMSDMQVATSYTASAGISVRLVRTKDGAQLWTRSFNQSKLFPGNNRFGLEGDTSALINDSQFQLALDELAQVLALDVYDSLVEVF